ncbi:MAG: hypothetical protein JW818_13805 [Pirellulales bacterium]|nr:hypothetical protein [Pirellulales bacterium]
MLAALLWKELREMAIFTATALLVYAYFLTSLLIPGYMTNAFMDTSAVIGYLFLSGAIAAGFAMRQTVNESKQGTFQFLLNRPVSRHWLIGMKLLVGAGLYLVVAGLPVMYYAWRLATPGNYPGPFAWWMTAMAWKAWAAGTVVYLGAFLSGLRPGRWIGTRLLPLVATGGAAVLIALMPWWWATGLPAVVLLDVLLARNIFHVARTRDFS